MSSEFRPTTTEDLPQNKIYPSPLRLDIGCGTQRLDNYVGVDAFVETDIKAEMWKVPLEDGAVDEIYSSHALEHVSMAMVQPTLKEWLRLLRPAGTLLLQVPNMDYVARFWLTHSHADHAWAEAIVFGNQAHDGEFHKCGFTPLGLQGDLQMAGFVVDQVAIIWAYNQETLQAKARKPESDNGAL